MDSALATTKGAISLTIRIVFSLSMGGVLRGGFEVGQMQRENRASA
jgi:hypothetical protein